MKKLSVLFASIFVLFSLPASVLADAPRPWQMYFQEPASEVAEKLVQFHDFLLVVITVITLFVMGLLGYIAVKFNEKANPVPSKTTHNTFLEIIWTTIPVLILVVIAIPSFRILYFADRAENPEMTLKIIGYQWYWGYEYPDHNNIAFESLMIKDEDLKEGQLRLLETDNRIILPVDTTVRLLTTASDVIHGFGVPSLGLKIDAVPGRLNETWVKITKPGVYRGQCSELCGVNHGFMPIVIEAVSKEEFAQWVASKSAKPQAAAEIKNKIALATN